MEKIFKWLYKEILWCVLMNTPEALFEWEIKKLINYK